MKFVISDKPYIPWTSTFVIDIDTMLGDGDAYGKFTLSCKTQEELERAVLILDLLKGEEIHELDEEDFYKCYPDAKEFDIHDSLTYDCNSGFRYGIDGYKIWWFNHAGLKFEVTIDRK